MVVSSPHLGHQRLFTRNANRPAMKGSSNLSGVCGWRRPWR